MSLKGNEWKNAFVAAKNVNEKCEVLDKTSNTILNTLTADIILGFFTFGAGWFNAIGRTISNWWGKAKRYRNLYALWKDVTAETNKMQDQIQGACRDIGIIDENTINLIRNCIRLTLALCARTYQEIDERGRWNKAIREDAYNALLYTTISTNNKQNQKWFDFLFTNIPSIRGMMSEFLTTKDAKEINDEINKRSRLPETLVHKNEIVASKEEFYNGSTSKKDKPTDKNIQADQK